MPIKRLILIVLLPLILASCKAGDGWVAQIGGANFDTVFGIAGTADGRSCVTGTYIHVVNFGSDEKPLTLDSGGYSDIFVACYAPDGAPLFASPFGVTNKNDQPRAIAALPGGDVVVTGFFSNSFGIQPGPVLQAPGAANADVFLARVDRTGAIVWARRYGGSQADSGRALAVDADGSILLAGSFQNLMPYTEDGVGHKLASAGSRDAFVMKLTPDGDILWSRRFGGVGPDEAFAVTTLADGIVVVAGTFAGEASSDGGQILQAVGYNDVFIQAWSADGEPLWTRAFGGPGQEYIGGLAGGDGHVWLAGSFQQEVRFANGESLTSRGSTDGMLVRFDADGNVDRTLSFGGSEVELVYGIARAADGTLLLTGHFQTEADLAPGPGESLHQASGTADTEGYVLVLDPDGKYRDAILLAGDDVAVGNGVIATANGGMVVTGIFGKQMRIEGRGERVLTSRGKSDVFVLGTAY